MYQRLRQLVTETVVAGRPILIGSGSVEQSEVIYGLVGPIVRRVAGSRWGIWMRGQWVARTMHGVCVGGEGRAEMGEVCGWQAHCA